MSLCLSISISIYQSSLKERKRLVPTSISTSSAQFPRLRARRGHRQGPWGVAASGVGSEEVVGQVWDLGMSGKVPGKS